MEIIFATVAALLYGASAALHARTDGAPPAPRFLTPAALLAHTVAVGIGLFGTGALAIGFGAALSLFFWQAALLLWVVCLQQPLQMLGIVIYPMAAVGALAGALVPESGTRDGITDWRTQVHVVLSLLAAGLLTLAAAQALFLALQDRFLHRQGSQNLLSALPPLQTMERVLFQLIGLGFFMLSLTLLSGLWFIRDWLAQHLVHKTILSIAAWIIFGTLLWGRGRFGWRGRQAVHWALSGYALLLLAYFGSKYVLEEILGRHWT